VVAFIIVGCLWRGAKLDYSNSSTYAKGRNSILGNKSTTYQESLYRRVDMELIWSSYGVRMEFLWSYHYKEVYVRHFHVDVRIAVLGMIGGTHTVNY
jgi:hypothetical protein